MKEAEFKIICEKRGFHRVAPKLYARCYGDGLYQTIYTGFRKYVSPFSPNYSPLKRKSNYIDIGIISMYSKLPETCFVEWPWGGCSPEELCGGPRPCLTEFHGIEAEYEKMCNLGFDELDKIQTQADFLEYWARTQKGTRNIRIHKLHLAIPFLMVGDWENAQFEIDHHIARSADGFHFHYDSLLEKGEIQEFMNAVNEHKQKTEYAFQLFSAVLGKNESKIQAIIRENVDQNKEWLQKYKIPLQTNNRFGIIPSVF